MTRKSAVMIAIVTTITSACNLSWAYHGEVHYRISEEAVKVFQLDSVLKTELGIEKGIEAEFKKAKETKPVWKWVADAGKAEDYGMLGRYDFLSTRAFNHFHDPLKDWDEAGFDKFFFNQHYFMIYGRYPVSAVLWGLKPGEQDFVLNFSGDWSWGKARDCFYHALSDLTKEERNQNFADCFRALGQVMHLLQDTSVPLHTRNDLHVFPILGAGPWTYETYTKRNIEKLTYTAHSPDPVLLTDPQPDQQYSNIVSISGLFDRNQYSKGDPIPLDSDILGLAEYSNANFLTEDTMWTYQHPSLDDTDYGRINWLNPEPVEAEDGKMDNRIYIRKTKGEEIDHLAAIDYWTLEYYDYVDMIYSSFLLDKECWKDYADKLIPRAVGYSAALLNYFFRGKLEVEFGKGDLKITNKSKEVMRDGCFELYYDNEDGERHDIAIYGAEVTTLNPEAAQTITFGPPSDFGEDEHYIVVYRGGLGNETDAVVGKVIDLSKPYLLATVSSPDEEPLCFLWDVEENQYADMEDDNGDPASFPCNPSEISNWLDSTVDVGRNLYAAETCGDSKSGPSWRPRYQPTDIDETTYWTTDCYDVDGTTPLINSNEKFAHWAGHPGAPDVTTIRNTVIVRAWAKSDAPTTKTLTILNKVSGMSACRTELLSQWLYTNYDGEDRLRDEWEEKSEYTIFTPIGELASWKVAAQYNLHEYNYPQYGDFNGESYYETLTSWRRHIIGLYSKRAMVQLFTVEARKRKLHRPCGVYEHNGFWVPCCYFDPCDEDYDRYEPAQEFAVLGAAEIVDDAENCDPRDQSFNPAFTSAVASLYSVSLAPVADDVSDVPAYKIILQIRE